MLAQPRLQVLQGQWFAQQGLRAEPICLSLELTGVLGGNYHDQYLWILPAYLSKHFHTISVRQAEIEEQNTNRITAQDRPGLLSGGNPDGDKAISTQTLEKIFSEDDLVINNKNVTTHTRTPIWPLSIVVARYPL